MYWFKHLGKVVIFRHGGCEGSDTDAHNIIKNFPTLIFVHPGTRAQYLNFNNLKSTTKVFEPKPFLERNHDIVNLTGHFLACPNSKIEQVRSGTWATIRYAKKINKPVYIIYPDGTMGYFHPENKGHKIIKELDAY